MSHVLLRFIAVALLITTSITVWAEPTPTPADSVSPETPLVKGPDLTITEANYRQALLGVPAQHRPSIERDSIALHEFLLELYTEQQMAREAQRLGLLDQPSVQVKLEMARRKVLVSAVLDHFKANLKQPDFTELAKEYYQTHRQDFTQPEQIQVAHILLRTLCPCEDQNGEKRKQAEQILVDLRGGADFAELAQKYSQDETTAKQGGELPRPVGRGTLVKPFEDAAFALTAPGAMSEVVETKYGYHLIKLISRQPETVLPFEQVQQRIVEKLAGEFQNAAHKEFVLQFYPEIKDYNEAAINALIQTSSNKPTGVKAVDAAKAVQ